MEKSLQEGHVSLQASRDEGRTGIGAVGILIVKEKAGESQDLKFLSKSKLHPRLNQGCLSLPFTLPSLSQILMKGRIYPDLRVQRHDTHFTAVLQEVEIIPA